MLTKYDEYFCHQIVANTDEPYTSDRNWTESLFFNAHEISGKVSVEAKFGYYPNRNLIDGYGGVVIDGTTQYTTCWSRELRPQLDEVKIGPLSCDVIEPLKRIRISLKENEYGVSFDLEFVGSFTTIQEKPAFHRTNGRITENVIRTFQSGRAKGWAKVEGQTYELTEDTCWAIRDRSWGVRPGIAGGETGVQPAEPRRGMFYQWVGFQFDKWAIAGELSEFSDGTINMCSGGLAYPIGDPRGTLELVKWEHDLEFHPGSRLWKSGKLVFTFDDGSKKEMTICHIGNHLGAAHYSRAGGYGSWKGFNHGLWMGPSWSIFSKLDISDQKVAEELQHSHATTEVRCGDEVGYGICCVATGGEYTPYGFK